RFDQWLRDCAISRGAKLMQARIERLTFCGRHWRAEARNEAGLHIVDADIFVEAAGRRSPMARTLGTKRGTDRSDRLACSWVHLPSSGAYGAGVTIIESTPDGWWYTAPIPNGIRVLAFHTHSHLPAARIAAEPTRLLTKARGTTREVARTLLECGPSILASGYTSAKGSFLLDPEGENCVAVGDAAIASCLIAGQCLLHAMYTGHTGATAVERKLSGDSNAFRNYARILASLIIEYKRGRQHCYIQEARFSCSPFWRRRNSGE